MARSLAVMGAIGAMGADVFAENARHYRRMSAYWLEAAARERAIFARRVPADYGRRLAKQEHANCLGHARAFLAMAEDYARIARAHL